MAVRTSSKTINLKKKAKKEAKRQIKKRPWRIALVLMLLVGAIGGFFVARFVTKNDMFEIIGDQTIYVNVGQTYEDEGAKVISFGRDISVNVQSDSNVDYSQPGEYFIKYTIKDVRFGGMCRYRYIIVQEVLNEE